MKRHCGHLFRAGPNSLGQKGEVAGAARDRVRDQKMLHMVLLDAHDVDLLLIYPAYLTGLIINISKITVSRPPLSRGYRICRQQQHEPDKDRLDSLNLTSR